MQHLLVKMELHELKKLIIKHRVKLVIFFGVLVVLAIIPILVLETPKEPPTTVDGEEIFFPEWSQPLDTPAQELDSLEKLFQQTPQDLTVYSKVETGKTYSEEEALGLATKLDFSLEGYMKLETTSGSVYVFEQNEKYLTIEQRPPSILYSTSSQNRRKGVIPSEGEAIAAGQAFLNNLGLDQLTYLPGSYKFIFSDEQHFTISLEKSQSNLVEISFNYLQEGYPIVGDSPAEYAAVILIDSKNTVVSFQFRELTTDFADPRVLQSKTFETALEEIQAGKGSVIYIEGIAGEEAALGKVGLSEFYPAKVFLAYYAGAEENVGLVYVFQGEGILTATEGRVFATVYLPAIASR